MDSPTHFAMSVVPSILLIAVGASWSLWPTGWKEVPATALSAGLTLLVLLAAVSAEYGAGVEIFFLQTLEGLLTVLLICYAASLLLFARRHDVNTWRLALLALLSLVPGYHLLGFTLVSSACGLQSAGC